MRHGHQLRGRPRKCQHGLSNQPTLNRNDKIYRNCHQIPIGNEALYGKNARFRNYHQTSFRELSFLNHIKSPPIDKQAQPERCTGITFNFITTLHKCNTANGRGHDKSFASFWWIKVVNLRRGAPTPSTTTWLVNPNRSREWKLGGPLHYFPSRKRRYCGGQRKDQKRELLVIYLAHEDSGLLLLRTHLSSDANLILN